MWSLHPHPFNFRCVRCEPLRLTHCLASSKSVAALPASCRWGLRGPVTLVLHILYYILLYYIILYIQRKINFEQPIHDGRLIRLDSMSTSNPLYDCRCTCVASKNMWSSVCDWVAILKALNGDESILSSTSQICTRKWLSEVEHLLSIIGTYTASAFFPEFWLQHWMTPGLPTLHWKIQTWTRTHQTHGHGSKRYPGGYQNSWTN